MKVEQNDGLAVAVGQGEHGTSYFIVARLFLERGVLSGLGGRFGDFIHRHIDGGEALEFGAEDVCREGEEPGGEAGFTAPMGKTAPGAQEGFLSHLFGAAAITAVTPGHIDERTLPAADDAFEGLDIAGEDAGDVGQVFSRAGGCCCQFRYSPLVRRSPLGETGGPDAGLHFLREKNPEENATGFCGLWSHQLQGEKTPATGSGGLYDEYGDDDVPLGWEWFWIVDVSVDWRGGAIRGLYSSDFVD